VRGDSTGWEIAELSEPVTVQSTYGNLSTTWANYEMRDFVFEYDSGTGISSFTVDGFPTVYSADIGLTRYGFQKVYLQAIARNGDTW
jgi:hypothetical protein